MIAKDLISYDIPSLSPDQTGRDAFHLLSDFHVKHLPVVDEHKLLGILSEEDIFNHKLYEPIREFDFSGLRRFAVRDHEHVFEVMRIMGENRLTIVPVIDEAENYLGMITQSEVLRFFANTASFAEPGGIVVLEMNRRDYSMSTIGRLVEEEGAKILSAYVTSTQDSEMMELTLKINRQDLSRILPTFERYQYDVKEAFVESDYHNNLKERYESLMSYLNV